MDGALLAPALAPHLVRPATRPAAGRPPLATGAPSLDALLGGGWPRGHLGELIGPRTSGRTSLLLGSLAAATRAGALAALVDVTDGLDPAAAGARDVALGRLLWVRCGGQLLAGLRAADVVLRGGGFDLVAVDFGDLPPGALARAPASAFVRLQRGVAGSPAALLLAAPRRLGGSLTAVAIGLTPRRVVWGRGGPGVLAGLAVEARLLRARGRAPGATTVLAWGAAP
jgi:hypothetical protein